MNVPFTKEQVKSLPNNWFTPSGTGPNRRQRRKSSVSLRKSSMNKHVTRWQLERDKNGRAKWIPHFDTRLKAMNSFLSTALEAPPTVETQE